MSFKDIIGQTMAKNLITAQLKSKKIPHAYIFLGDSGVGRKKTALELAKALNCETNPGADPCGHCIPCNKITSGIHPDVQLINFALQAGLDKKELEKQKSIKIDTIRYLQKEVFLRPSEGKWKIFIIEPAEKITIEAANSLLKTLEEPPAWTVIILLARHKENLPSTIVSRTQIVRFGQLDESVIKNYLIKTYSADEETATKVAIYSEGSFESASRIFETLRLEPESIWPKIASGNLSVSNILNMSQKLAKNAQEVLEELLLNSKLYFRSDPRNFRLVSQSVLESRRMLERNVNPQFILDALLLKLAGYFER
jgi:DNA polymerase-3 subunit delta'